MNSMSCSGSPARSTMRVAVAGAGVSGGAGLVDPAATAGGDDGHVGAEAVDRSILQAPGEQATAAAVLVHQQVDGKILDEEARLVLEALLVERVQDRVAGAVGGGAGSDTPCRPSHIPSCARRSGAGRSCRPRCG